MGKRSRGVADAADEPEPRLRREVPLDISEAPLGAALVAAQLGAERRDRVGAQVRPRWQSARIIDDGLLELSLVVERSVPVSCHEPAPDSPGETVQVAARIPP